MSFIPVLEYIIGLGVFGFIYWLLNGIIGYMTDANVHVTGTIWEFLNYIWIGIIIIYIIFGGIWLIRKYNELEYTGGNL